HERRRVLVERARQLLAERLFAGQIELAVRSDQHRVELLLDTHRAKLREPLGRPIIQQLHPPSLYRRARSVVSLDSKLSRNIRFSISPRRFPSQIRLLRRTLRGS